MSGNKPIILHDEPPTYDEVMGASVSSSFGLNRPFLWPSSPGESLLPLPKSASSSRTGSPAGSRSTSRTPSPDRNRRLYSPNSIIPSENHNVLYAKDTPTVVPTPTFNSHLDARFLLASLNSGIRSADIIKLVCSRSNEQRIKIKDAYLKIGGRNLELGFDDYDFRKVMVALFQPLMEFYCDELASAMDSFDVESIFQILTVLSNDEMSALGYAFEEKFEITIPEKIATEKYDEIRDEILLLCQGKREENERGDINEELFKDDLKVLMSRECLIAEHFHRREPSLRKIFVERSFKHLHKLFAAYASVQDSPGIEKMLKGLIPYGKKPFYMCVARYALSKHQFFARCLKKSMEGLGTDKIVLNRILIARCEIDLYNIKIVFQQQYGKSLRKWIKGDTSGTYKYILYGLIGEQRSNE